MVTKKELPPEDPPDVPRIRLDPPTLPSPDADTEMMDVEGAREWYRFWKPRRPRMGDRRLAVAFLGFVGMLAVIADFVLLLNGNDPPGGLLAVAGGCVGALATLVTAAPTRSEPPTHQ